MKIAFIITRKRNNVVVSFGTLKAQSMVVEITNHMVPYGLRYFYVSLVDRKINLLNTVARGKTLQKKTRPIKLHYSVQV